MARNELEPLSEFTNNADKQYLALLTDILQNGTESSDRTGTGTLKVFGRMLKFNLAEGYPLLTTKKVWFTGVKEELLWMIRGERNIHSLVLKSVNIWNEWPLKKFLESQGLNHIGPKKTPELWKAEMAQFVARIKEDEEFASVWGDLGPVYGWLWRHWQTRDGGEIDQLAHAIHLLKTKPDSRRIVITAWNPEDVDKEKVALPPCHIEYQFGVQEKEGQKFLNCMMYQRSADTFLGLPFNIASYALLTELVAKITDMQAGELTLALCDTHLYLDHLEQAKLQLTREPKALPKLYIHPSVTDIDNIYSGSVLIAGYNPHPKIEGEISI